MNYNIIKGEIVMVERTKTYSISDLLHVRLSDHPIHLRRKVDGERRGVYRTSLTKREIISHVDFTIGDYML